MIRRVITFLGIITVLVGGCATESAPELEDGESDVGVTAGKTDGPFTECELRETLALVNDPGTGVPELRAIRVASRAATNIVKHRNCGDTQFGTEDDNLFDTADELDDVAYVGPATFRSLVAAVEDRCRNVEPGAVADVIFSPQAYEQCHLARFSRDFETAQRSIDIAMYSFRDAGVMDALKRARERGVIIRRIFEPAGGDRTNPAGTTSARIEDLGIDDGDVNKIMHHKFAIIDGPREDIESAATELLITGSGYLSNSAVTKLDENTTFLRVAPEVSLRFQREFNHLWTNSRDFVWNQSLPAIPPAIEITDADITDDPSVDAVFTSANFRVFQNAQGLGFTSIVGHNTIADRWVSLIESARTSIKIASGHLRSRPVVDALLAKLQSNPEVEIRIYLDGQEYISQSGHNDQLQKREDCLAAAGTSEARRQDCLDKEFLYGLQVGRAGATVRYKYYAYRWDAGYAEQMHHKYMVIDGATLWSGSYNLSDNAEHGTFENMMVFRGPQYAGLVGQFEANFESMWNTSRDDDKLAGVLQRVESSPTIPIVFEPMALSWNEVTNLKSRIRANCPAVDSTAFRQNAAGHQSCTR